MCAAALQNSFFPSHKVLLMLYQLYETQRTWMEPLTDMAAAASKLYGNPNSPAGRLPLAHRVSAGYSLLHRLGKDYGKPEFNLHKITIDGAEAVIDEQVEMDKPFCQLRHFKRFTDDAALLEKIKKQPVVLIVAPLSGHYATLLRDTVRTMLQGHDVFITDWKNARDVPLDDGEFHLDDYVNYVEDFIRHLQAVAGQCHVVSVCQPVVPVLGAVALMASRGETTPLSMTLMAGPVDARRSPTAVNRLATGKSLSWFENNVIYRVPPKYPGAGRRVYPGFLQHAGFIAMNPGRHASSHYDYFRNLIRGDESSAETHRRFYDEYNAVLDMDADYYLETIKAVFQDYALPKGTWSVRNSQGQLERVRPQDITDTALLTVEGELDDISGSGQTEVAHALCTSLPPVEGNRLTVMGAGHYGVFSGSRWREKVYPHIRDFIARSEAAAARKAAASGPAPQAAPAGSAAPVKPAAVQPAEAPKAAAPKPAETKPAAPKAAAAPKAEAKPAAPKTAAKGKNGA